MFKRSERTEQSDQQSKPVSKNESRWAVAASVAAVTVGLIIVLGYILPGEWGGFTEYTTPKSDAVEYHPRRTLWDLLSLLVIPAVLLIAGALFTQREREKDDRLARERAEVDRELAEKRAEKDRELAATDLRDAALREYFDRMSDLLLNYKLAISSAEDPVRDVARTRTLTILRTLSGDSERKGSVVRFLYEAELIKGDTPVIELGGADLGKAGLQRASLQRANLRGTLLQEADLPWADLQGADLRKANLQDAKLPWADLREARLQGAYLYEANLQEAYLQGANLQQANLPRANLRKARLQVADLQGAVLQDADLQGAFLRGANLEGAIVTPEQLLEAANLDNATLPDGTIHYSPQPKAKSNTESQLPT
jgi:uncharacterized protein YjbI with pentapeptide repeats